MKEKRYPTYEGGWVYPRRTGYHMACCDCGLVHTLYFDTVTLDSRGQKKIRFKVDRDNRRTAQFRRYRKGWRRTKKGESNYPGWIPK